MEYVSRYQSAGSLLVSTVVLGAAVLFGSLFLAPNAAHASAPTTYTASFQDANIDGSIDRLVVVVNGGEALSSCVVDATEIGSDWTVIGGGYAPVSLVSATCNTGTATITFVITAIADITGGVSAPTLAYDNDDADNSIANASGNLGAVGAVTSTDDAGPVLLSSSPTAGQRGVNDTANVVLTFSEPLVSYGDTLTPSVVTGNSGAGTGIVTVTHSPRFPAGQMSYDIVTATDAAGKTFAGAQAGDSTVSDPLVFYVSSGSDSEEEVEVTYSVNLLTPEVSDMFEAGEMTDITWESDGGTASYANLYYSEDGGSTWETIVTNTLNDGTYNWTTPHVNSDEVMVKVVTTDLAEELATDTSEAFSVWFYDEDGDVAEDEESDEEVADEEVTEIDGIMAGDYIKGESAGTIYWIDDSMMRRPFFNEQTYFTYEDSFDAVVEVSDETLAEFVMGAPMMPKAGVVLVKIQSVAKVYYVEQDAYGDMWLRWVTSEDVAEEMFGASWDSYIVDVDVTLFTRYEEGDDINSAFTVDMEDMKLRTELHD